MLFSQSKASKTVADISVSGTKLHVSYSDGSGKDMDMPPATSLRLPHRYQKESIDGYTLIDFTSYYSHADSVLQGTVYYNNGRTDSFSLADWH